jgi:hypothetical protein
MKVLAFTSRVAAVMVAGAAWLPALDHRLGASAARLQYD